MNDAIHDKRCPQAWDSSVRCNCGYDSPDAAAAPTIQGAPGTADQSINYGAILDALDALPADLRDETARLAKLVRAYGCQIGHCEHDEHAAAVAESEEDAIILAFEKERVEIERSMRQDALCDAAYVAGAQAGFNAAASADPMALTKLLETRAGYLKALLQTRAGPQGASATSAAPALETMREQLTWIASYSVDDLWDKSPDAWRSWAASVIQRSEMALKAAKP